MVSDKVKGIIFGLLILVALGLIVISIKHTHDNGFDKGVVEGATQGYKIGYMQGNNDTLVSFVNLITNQTIERGMSCWQTQVFNDTYGAVNVECPQ